MASRGSDTQAGERPPVGEDGRTSRDEGYAVNHTEDRGETYGDPDVVVDVPTLNVEEIDLEVEDLQVRVALQAVLADLVQINVGLKAELGEVKLTVKGVEAQAVDETGDVSGPPAGGGAEERGEPEATEAARNKARELGVNLSGLKGTGSGGRIIVRDVAKAARG